MTLRTRLLRPAFLLVAALAPLANPIPAQTLSRSLPIDFYRDVSSRNLKGLAARSDGRLVAGPVLTDLDGSPFADILWCLEPSSKGKWLIGTGSDGKIFEITLDAAKASFSAKELVDLEEPQIFTLKRLADGSLLAGTSPNGALVLIRDGKIATRVALPVDSIFDIVPLPAAPGATGARNASHAIVATGNPGRLYKIDLAKFAGAGVNPDKLSDTAELSAKGVSLVGEIRDRNIRRLALVGEDLIAGSSPKGNIYRFTLNGDASVQEGVLLQENRDAEVAALLPRPNGEFYAALVFTSQQAENRLNRPQPAKPADSPATAGTPAPAEPTPPPATPPAASAPADRFPGRSAVVYFPRNGFPETVVSRTNLAFYAIGARGDTLLIAGGEQGDLLGYDLNARLGLTYAGSASAQINQIVALPDGDTQFLLLRNNAPGLALIDFAAPGTREVETRRIDLGTPSRLGALRFARLRAIEPGQVSIDLRTSVASDEAEGWTPWTAATFRDDGWYAPEARGRYFKARVKIPAAAQSAQFDNAEIYFLPQNRRPTLSEFRIIPPNYAMIPPPESAGPSPVTTLGSLISNAERDRSEDRRRSSLNSSTVFPQPGMQIVTWTVADSDGDELRSTFSIRREGTDTWIDLAVNTADGFVQFDTSHLQDGVYFTRVVATEQAPRPAAERLTATFETDELIIDRTPPKIADVKAARETDALVITVSGQDAVALLEGAEFIFNNGYRDQMTQPVDGIRDSKVESFALRAPLAKVAGATSVEVLLYDETGNSSARRIALP